MDTFKGLINSYSVNSFKSLRLSSHWHSFTFSKQPCLNMCHGCCRAGIHLSCGQREGTVSRHLGAAKGGSKMYWESGDRSHKGRYRSQEQKSNSRTKFSSAMLRTLWKSSIPMDNKHNSQGLPVQAGRDPSQQTSSEKQCLGKPRMNPQ